jgi:hypothetical protein
METTMTSDSPPVTPVTAVTPPFEKPAMTTPKIKVADLREYKVGTGGRYFVGRWGGARVVLLPDDETPLTGREVGRWRMYLEEGPASPDSPETPPAKRRLSEAERREKMQRWL